jgi:hypothetical protein
MFQTFFSNALCLTRSIASKRMALLGLALVPFAGCGGGTKGPPRAAVRGEVRLDDVPLKAGVIRFVPEGATKGPVALTTIKDGRFTLSASDGPSLGKHSVEIMASPAENPLEGAMDIRTAWADYARSKGSRPVDVKIPARYNQRSTLSVEVTPKGSNAFDFKLASQ